MPTQQKCGLCDRQFTRTEHLARHIRSHTKQKPFACLVCSKTYVREDTLARHARSHRSHGIRQDNANISESQFLPDGSDSSSQVLSSGSFSAPAPSALPQFLIDQNADVQAGDLTMIDMSVSTSSTAHRMEFHDIFGPEIGSWDFGNSSMMEMFQIGTTGDGYSMQTGQFASEPMLLQNTQPLQVPRNSNASRAAQSGSNMEPSSLDLQKMWFTRLSSPEEDSSRFTPLSPAQSPTASVSDVADISDQYRLRLSKEIFSPLPQDDPLPSSDFLNQCVRMYFNHFNTLFPALHNATFRPTPDNGLLLLSVASIGCLFMGSQAAVRQGKQIFVRVHKAILTSWESALVEGSSDILAMLQAAMIGQTFALLSGESKHIAIFEMFHGALISLTRRLGMLDSHAAISGISVSESFDLETTWRRWARREQINRLHACLRIHDAEMSALLHREPLMRKNAGDPPQLSTTRMFLAATASDWASVVQSELEIGSETDYESGKSFSGYVALEGLGSSIADDRRNGRLGEATSTAYQETLMSWYNRYAKFTANEEPGQQCMVMLWHWTYMSLLVDFDQLERAIGRDGQAATKSADEYVSSWVLSPDSTRCVLHAVLLQRQLESFKFDQVLEIYVPRITFAAAIAWHCYLQHGPTDNVTSLFGEMHIHFPEFTGLGLGAFKQLSDITSLSWKHGDTSMIRAATLCKFGILLQRMVHWGIAGRFAELVALLIDR